MSNNWKVQRKEGRVAVTVPIEMEILNDRDDLCTLGLLAENVSRDGFRFSLNNRAEPLDFEFQVGREYEITIRYARKRIKGIISIVWKNDYYCGVRFVERDKGWIVN